ncbi:MAG: DUF1801 domain-containing protein [Spirochaetia bacterium]|jgi:hypothetical protein|nr:DUF1801 domain-containing protein [Spirochaetia bacterium]
MGRSKKEQVQKFLEDIMMINSEKFKILQKLRKIVFSNYPKTNERIMYGGIMFSFENDFGGLFVRKNHISFEFVFGVYMDDPHNILEGTGKLRRHIKIRTLTDIEDKKVDSFVKQSL